MKRSRLLVLPAALLVLVAATHHPARLHATGQEPAAAAVAQAPALQGTFVLEPGANEKVVAAINAGTARMNFIKRPIARSRLKKTNLPPYGVVRISHTPTEVSIDMDGRAPILTPADGKTIKWKRPEDGEILDVNTVWESGTLKETFVAGDGSRENLFSISPDGEVMTMQVTIRSPQLGTPIVYKLDYRRKAS